VLLVSTPAGLHGPGTRRSLVLAPRTFARRVAATCGVSPIQFVQQIRLETARFLLETTRLPLEQIAQQVGYAEPSTLRRLIRRATKHSPRHSDLRNGQDREEQVIGGHNLLPSPFMSPPISSPRPVLKSPYRSARPGAARPVYPNARFRPLEVFVRRPSVFVARFEAAGIRKPSHNPTFRGALCTAK
jgi:AraC-like DNA-binding protein